jgi:hypothetical protein
MNRTIRITGIISVVLLSAGAIMKLLYLPDQLIILGAGIALFILVILPAFLIFNLRRSADWKGWLLHITGFLFCMVFLLSFGIILQGWHSVFTIMSVITGILVLVYFVLLLLKRTDIIDEKIKWPFLSAYLAVTMLIFLNLPLEVQGADKFYKPDIGHPSYPKNSGPLIYIDQGHYNFHTLNGRLRSTAQLLRRDGYRVLPYDGQFESGKLKDCRILMIVNALNEADTKEWVLPAKSAFDDEEIKTVSDWIRNGGSLLLVADHMPFAGAAAKLAVIFGFIPGNGFAMDTIGREDYFIRSDTTLHSNFITNGRNKDEWVDSILTFTGHAFEIPEDAVPFMTFSGVYLQWYPDTAWNFRNVIPLNIEGYSQGAYKKFGDGRVVVLGEAMMITAQLAFGLSWKKIGMNSPQAPYNYKLLLNIIHWLDGEE